MTAYEQITQEAEARGLGRGLRQVIIRQMTLKFGPPDPDTLRAFERATPEQLSECAERILTATSLDELLFPLR